MKYIHKFKSLNFNKRKSKEIKFIIIHYTALKSISESIKYLCEKNNKVSSHYIISKKGEIYNLVSEKKRAWHAGASYWNGLKDINSSSIGIELDYLPDEINTEYDNFFAEAYENFDELKTQRIIEIPSVNYNVTSSNEDVVNISNFNMTSNSITFTTDRPNELHMIKTSYFPNWEIKNGDGPYRISPSFMAVIPYSENVELTFVRTGIEMYSFYTALASLLLYISFSKKRKAVE